jgi:hypothetical protein
MRVIETITKIVYGLFGLFFVLVGGSVLLFNTGLLPTAARDIVLSFADNDLRILHVIQEWGNAHLLLGLVIFWFIRHYDQSQTFHWLLTAYLAIDALIHWFHVAGPPETITGPVILTVPVAIFVALGLLRSVPRSVAPPAGFSH